MLPELDALVDAFARGDYAQVRADGPELEKATNDDAVRAIKLLLSALADAVAEGEQTRKAEDFNEEGEEVEGAFSAYDEVEPDDEALLGASTLAKLRNAKLFEEEEE